MGSIDGFRDSVSGEGDVFVIQANEKENQMGEFEKTGCKEETKANRNFFMQENQSLSEVFFQSSLISIYASSLEFGVSNNFFVLFWGL